MFLIFLWFVNLGLFFIATYATRLYLNVQKCPIAEVFSLFMQKLLRKHSSFIYKCKIGIILLY